MRPKACPGMAVPNPKPLETKYKSHSTGRKCRGRAACINFSLTLFPLRKDGNRPTVTIISAQAENIDTVRSLA